MNAPTLVILAAGMGSRYGSLKQIEPIGPGGEAIIEYSVYDAIKAGFGKVVFVIKEAIEADFKENILSRFDSSINYECVFQELDILPEGYTVPEGRTKPWGTAHAIMVAESAVNTPFAAINADDFYGYEAFEEMCNFLTNRSSESEYCMIGYKLLNTLSDHGTVSRGLCNCSSEGLLKSITELTKIERVDGNIVYYENEEPKTLAEDSTVSMNIWGFTPKIFSQIRERFSQFLDHNIADMKSEFYIPQLVDQLINENEATVKVITCNSTWFGITYKEDRNAAKKSLMEKIDKGEYPERLWA